VEGGDLAGYASSEAELGAPQNSAAAKRMTTNGTIAWIVIVIGLIPITGKVLFSAWRLARRVV
jgi:hypothetical protein